MPARSAADLLNFHMEGLPFSLGEGVCIVGGAVTDALRWEHCGGPVPVLRDLDIYPGDSWAALEAALGGADGWEFTNKPTSVPEVGPTRQVWRSADGVIVDMIGKRAPTVADLLARFDIDVCKVAFDGTRFHEQYNAREAIRGGVATGVRSLIAKRVAKHEAKGYAVVEPYRRAPHNCPWKFCIGEYGEPDWYVYLASLPLAERLKYTGAVLRVAE